MSRVLLTGMAGFIPSHILGALVTRKRHRVFGIDNFSTGSPGNLLPYSNKFETFMAEDGIIPWNITMDKPLLSIFNEFKPEIVMHLAAQPSLFRSKKKPRLDAMSNIIGTIQLLRYAREYEVQKFIFASTSAVYSEDIGYLNEEMTKYGEPSSPYGISKLTAEMYIRNMFPNHVIFRLANIYGPRQVPIGKNQLVPRAIMRILGMGNEKIYGESPHTRDFMYVDDVVKAFVATVTKDVTGTFNLSTGQSVAVTDVLNTLKEIAEWDGEWDEGTVNDPRIHVSINNDKYKKAFGVRKFTSLEKGLRLTFLWWKKRHEISK